MAAKDEAGSRPAARSGSGSARLDYSGPRPPAEGDGRSGHRERARDSQGRRVAAQLVVMMPPLGGEARGVSAPSCVARDERSVAAQRDAGGVAHRFCGEDDLAALAAVASVRDQRRASALALAENRVEPPGAFSPSPPSLIKRAAGSRVVGRRCGVVHRELRSRRRRPDQGHPGCGSWRPRRRVKSARRAGKDRVARARRGSEGAALVDDRPGRPSASRTPPRTTCGHHRRLQLAQRRS